MLVWRQFPVIYIEEKNKWPKRPDLENFRQTLGLWCFRPSILLDRPCTHRQRFQQLEPPGALLNRRGFPSGFVRMTAAIVRQTTPKLADWTQ